MEFETFYQNILKDISHLPVDYTTRLKTKLRHTCKKYSQIKVLYQYRTVISNLRRNKNLAMLKQDKGRGIVILKNVFLFLRQTTVQQQHVTARSNIH